MDNDNKLSNNEKQHIKKDMVKTINLSGMYESWFLEYASYVILDRAVPSIQDGLKPVQRRILHSMREMDDGRYNKVANIIGNTMKYHPHGDASIGDALVQLGQKDLLIDCQGNWGNSLTGDSAAASRYIEARLSKFALDVVFNPKTTEWKRTYDGRNREPIDLPTKFPLLLAQGVEGIAVGLAAKTLPHNFIEIIDASIAHLKEKDFDLLPDFPTGGLADVSRYNDGQRGGRVRVRSKIKQIDKKTLAITELPFGCTTSKLIDSIILANDKGKIKIKKIDDNTAADVEILIHLAGNVSPDQTIDALYAFTDCEISISPNSCTIQDNRPRFMGVKEILRHTCDHTVTLLKWELEIKKRELLEKLLQTSLEKIFIEERIYKDNGYENAENREAAIRHIDKRLDPFKKLFYRQINDDDIIRLFEIKMGRILKFNSEKAEELLAAIDEELKQVEYHLANLIEYAINWYIHLRKTYGKGRERKTELRSFDNIEATRVAVANEKLFINREDGFAGTQLKKDEFVCDCSSIDDIIVFREDGSFKIVKVSNKFFVGNDVIHIAVFTRNDERTIYNAIYQDGTAGNTFVKRFAVKSITRDKDYTLTKGTDHSKIIYFSANPNGEAEVVKVNLRKRVKVRKLQFDFDFSTLAIKGRGATGNILSKTPVLKIQKKEDGISTLGAIDLWFDDTVNRLNTDERGEHIGGFKGDDKIITIMKSGKMRFYNFDVSNHFDDDILLLEKFDEKKILTIIYWNSELKAQFIKRIVPEVSDRVLELFPFENNNKLIDISYDYRPQLQLSFDKRKNKQAIDDEILDIENFIGVKGIKAKGKRVSSLFIKKLNFIDVLPHKDVVNETKKEETKETPIKIETKETEVINKEENIKETERVEKLKQSNTSKIKTKQLEETSSIKKDSTKTERKPKKTEKVIKEKPAKKAKKEIVRKNKPTEKETSEESIKQDPDDIPLDISNDTDGQMTFEF